MENEAPSITPEHDYGLQISRAKEVRSDAPVPDQPTRHEENAISSPDTDRLAAARGIGMALALSSAFWVIVEVIYHHFVH